jgi:hypothetical protein
MTRQQITLEFYWYQRERARQQRIDEASVLQAIAKAFGAQP